MDDGHQLGARVQEFFVLVQEKLPVVVERGNLQDGAGLLGEDLPGDDVGVVLHPRDDYLVAFADVLAAVGLGDEVDSLGGSPDVDELVVLGGIDEAADLAAGGLVVVGGVLAEGVNAAMDVGVLGYVVVDQGVDDALGFLAGGGVVQVDQGVAVDFLVKDREVPPGCVPRRRCCWERSLGPPERQGGAGYGLQEEGVQEVLQRFQLHGLDDFAGEGMNEDLAGSRNVQSAAAHVEEGVFVDVAGGGAVPALYVVGVDEKAGLAVHLGVVERSRFLSVCWASVF